MRFCWFGVVSAGEGSLLDYLLALELKKTSKACVMVYNWTYPDPSCHKH
jgi:hypothetical protein